MSTKQTIDLNFLVEQYDKTVDVVKNICSRIESITNMSEVDLTEDSELFEHWLTSNNHEIDEFGDYSDEIYKKFFNYIQLNNCSILSDKVENYLNSFLTLDNIILIKDSLKLNDIANEIMDNYCAFDRYEFKYLYGNDNSNVLKLLSGYSSNTYKDRSRNLIYEICIVLRNFNLNIFGYFLDKLELSNTYINSYLEQFQRWT